MESEIPILEVEIAKSERFYNQFRSKLPDKGERLLKEIEKKKDLLLKLQNPIKEEKKLVMPNISTNEITSKINRKSSESEKPQSISSIPRSSSDIEEKKLNNSKDFAFIKPRQINPKNFVSEISCPIKQSYIRNIAKESSTSYISKEDNCTFENIKQKNVDATTNQSSLPINNPSSLPINNPSFLQYRDPARKFKAVEIIEPPDKNPEIVKSSKQNSQCLGSVSTKNVTQSSSVKDVALKIHNSLINCPSASEEEVNPINLKTLLMKHQRTALKWLLWRETQSPQGGIFADDMGLGKTLTLISLILKENESNCDQKKVKDAKIGGTLVVCVASILHQWNYEIEKHCKENSLKVLIYHGPNREKFHKQVMNYDVVLTTYDIIRNEGKLLATKRKESPLLVITWNRVILDEAHTIKNYKTQTAQWIFKLSSIKKWAVTGTPIHNDLKDFYCLIKFLQCEPFADLNTWKKLISDMSDRSVNRRNALIKTILLRRCKGDIDETTGDALIPLPDKKIKISMLHLNEEEKFAYDNIEKEIKEKYSKFHIKKTNSALPNESFTKKNGIFLSYLLKLQQCCNHLSLLKLPVQDDTLNNSLDCDISRTFESLNIKEKSSNTDLSETLSSLNLDDTISPYISDVNLSFINQDFKHNISEQSSKIKKLILKLKEILNKPNNNEKCVIVSQWVKMLEIIGFHLNNHNINYHVIDGKTKSEDRQHISKDFNYNISGFPVLLLSLKAGGVGLNLTGGNHLFLMDMHWNPALENQACDRIHRVGQIRNVYIHKFICIGTIEEKIFELQKQKRHLAGTVLSSTKSVPYLNFDDFKKLFEVI